MAEMERQENTQYVASISRGKDSNAMIHVIKNVLHYPLDRIVTVQVWATQDIPAELPPMVAWQDECDKRILDMFGVPVERLFAKDKNGNKVSYNDIFYRTMTHKTSKAREAESKSGLRNTHGFPIRKGGWCRKLKMDWVQIFTASQCEEAIGVNQCSSNVQSAEFSSKPQEQGAKINTVQYIGIAADEPDRIARHKDKKGIVMPLVDAGWTEKMCYEWCADNGLLAPTYTTSMRAAAGSAIIKAWHNFATCGIITPTCGNCSCNGIPTALLHSIRTVTRYTTSMHGFGLKTRGI